MEKLVVWATVISICFSFGCLVTPKPLAAWLFLMALAGFFLVIIIAGTIPPPVNLSESSMAELERLLRPKESGKKQGERGED